MPSFKKRFQPSRKYKKTKDAGSTHADEYNSSTSTSGLSTCLTTTTVASANVDDHNAITSISNYSSHYSVEYYLRDAL
ncbi:unnamed protein product [Rotaria magnacalcarata]|uniref:Uncharacterized protein n=1 Tax=Rotaria magnacalcarata TaxID=392030 RepID=A0A816MDR7_9BILA|nr:unnamed protein product [Rotaria magnacalcarata]